MDAPLSRLRSIALICLLHGRPPAAIRSCAKPTPKEQIKMILSQLQEKRNKTMADATAIMAGDTITVEQRTQFDSMLADVAVIDGDITRVKAVEEHRAAMREPVNQPRPNPSESNDPEERAEVRQAAQKASLRSYMQTGIVEKRDLTSVNSGVAIPIGFNPQVISAQKSYGEIYDIVNVVKTDHGNPIKMVLDNDTTNGLVSVTVGTAAGEVDPALTGVTLQVDNFTTGVVKIDNGFLTDAGFDVDKWLRDKFLKRFFRGASGLILAGDGGSVASLTAAYDTQGFTSSVTNKLSYVDFATAIGTLEPAYQMNSVWAMNTATVGTVIGLTDTAGRPLFLPGFGDGSLGFVGSILGRPVKLVTQLPNVATGNVPVLYGDFSEAYSFRQQNPGIGILRLNELFAAGFETGFVGFARVGGVVTDAGTHPVIGITIK
jgi:HK97 family phage major capsid protein